MQKQPSVPANAIALICILLVTAVLCPGCISGGSPASIPGDKDQAITFTDSAGATVTLPGRPDRIVCLNTNAAEVLAAIGAGDRVIGVSESLMADPSMAGRFPNAHPLKGSWNSPNIESILELKPDLVITLSSASSNLDSLEQAGIPVIRFDCYILNRLPPEVETLGRITGHEDEAARYLAWYNKTVMLVNSRLADIPQEQWPTIYCEGGSDFASYGNGSGADAIISMAHGNNLAHTINTAWVKVSGEWVLQQDPDILVRVAYASNLQNQTYGQISAAQLNRTSIAPIRAIRNGRVYIIDNRSMYGPRGLLTLLYLSKVFYPERFADIDLRQRYRDYCDTFACTQNSGNHYYPSLDSLTAGSSDSGDPQGPVTITDSNGKVFTLPHTAQRIICQNSDAAEMLIALGAGDRIVGITDTSLNDPLLKKHLKNAESIGNWQTPNIERILALKPDVILTYTTPPKNAGQMAAANLTIIAVDCYKIPDLARDAEALGILTGTEDRAKEYRAFNERHLALVSARIAERTDRKLLRVYVEGYTDYSAHATGSGGDHLLKLLNATNIAGTITTQWATVSPEWVIDQNPDVILKIAMSPEKYDHLDAVRLKILGRPGFDRTRAVADDRVYVMNGDVISSPRGIVGLLLAAKALYPEQFADIDAEGVLEEYAGTFVDGADRMEYFSPLPLPDRLP
ncbi:MAG: ABC transporter substrate-binding protein [Methanoregula sp.]|nr:ABC transporter substrate-binding protein [Methanoregula sp.]